MWKPFAGVAELVDANDSKSFGGDSMEVQVLSPAQTNQPKRLVFVLKINLAIYHI